jgi:hypothetical protein
VPVVESPYQKEYHDGTPQYLLFWTNSKGQNFARAEWYAGKNGINEKIRKIAKQKTVSMIAVMGIESRMAYDEDFNETGIREFSTLIEACVLDRKSGKMIPVTGKDYPVYGIPGIRYDFKSATYADNSEYFTEWVNCLR